MTVAAIPRWARLGAYAAAYLALAWVGDWLTSVQSDFGTFWPPAGLALAALLLSPGRDWPWLLGLGAACNLMVSALVDRGPAMAAVNALADAGEAFLGAFLVRRLVAARPTLGSIKEVLGFLVLAAGLSPALAALPGAYLVWLKYPFRGYPGTWLEWGIGDALGILVVAPFLLCWTAPEEPVPAGRRGTWPEAAAIFGTLGVAAFLMFGAGEQITLSRQYLVLPALLWAALRFGVRGASLSAVILAGLAAWAGSAGLPAPGGVPPPGRTVQGFLGVTIAATLLLAAALAERARAERALRESEDRFDLFLEHSPAFLFLKDAQGRIKAMSRSLARVAGRPPREVVGRAGEDLFPALSPEVMRQSDERVLATGQASEVAVEYGSRSLLFVKFPVPQQQGPPLIGAVGLDLTAQRRAERALRLAQFALDHASDAVLFLDPQGRASYANEAAARQLGRGRHELPGRPVWELDAAFTEGEWAERWRELLERGALVRPGELVGGDGSRHEVEVGLAHLAFGDREYCIYAARDLTDRRRAEESLRMASLGTLAAGIGHEINNPLSYVVANLAFASETLGPIADRPQVAEALGALSEAAEGARRVGNIVRDLRRVSRAEGRQRVEVDLHAEIRTALGLAQNEIRHRASLELRLDPVPAVEASPSQLGQVFLNLLVNAAHAIPDGQADRHVIRVACYTAEDGRPAVEVADSGSGISAAVRPHIFEPVFTTKPLGTGTGLGLSICHGIVASLGGEIEVESEEGRGSLFRVLLPPAARRAAPATPPPGERPPVRRARVLVVDDEPLVGRGIRRVLGRDHEVVVVTDPREALERLAGGERFDLVLCDLLMPQMTGMELHHRLAQVAPQAADQLVFMTGGAFTPGAQAFLAAGPRAVLAKPFDEQLLRELVRDRMVRGAAAVT